MYKLLIVDDESLVRLGIKQTIDWAKYGIAICGEGRNGQDGFEKAKALHPDVIICDVRMPGTDGLQLAKMLREAKIDSELVFLSGYDKFEYAKDAIEYQATSYLLKPVSNEDLTKAVLKALEIHKAKAQNLTAREILNDAKEEVKRRAIYSVLHSKESDLEQARRDLAFQGIDFIEQGHVLVGVIDEPGEKDSMTLLEPLERNLIDVFRRHGMHFVSCILQDRLIAFADEDSETLEQALYEALALPRNDSSTFSLGISKEFVGVEQAPAAYTQALGVATNGLFRFMNSVQLSDGADRRFSPNLIRALDIIHREYMNPLNVNYVIERLNVSESYLMHMFKNQLGKTFNKVLTETRIFEAKRLLRTNKYRVNEVAGMVGFSDEKYFTLIFKKLTGTTPSEFMKSK